MIGYSFEHTIFLDVKITKMAEGSLTTWKITQNQYKRISFILFAVFQFTKLLIKRSNNQIQADTVQKMKFSIKDFFSKCEQIRRELQIWSHLLKKSLLEKLIFRAATVVQS